MSHPLSCKRHKIGLVFITGQYMVREIYVTVFYIIITLFTLILLHPLDWHKYIYLKLLHRLGRAVCR